MNPLPFVLAQWRQSRATLWAMAVLIAIACAIGLGVTSLERAVREASNRAAARFDLIVGAAGSETQLVLSTVYLQPAALKLMPSDVLKRLRKDTGVQAATPVAIGDSVAGFSIVGTDAEFASQQGRYRLQSGRWFNAHDEAVAGSATSLQMNDSFTPLHGSANDNAIEEQAHEGHRMRIVGRLLPTGTPWDRAVLVPFDSVLEMHRGGHAAGVPAIVVKPRSVMDAYRLRASYRRADTTAVFPAETLNALYHTLGDVRELVFWIASSGQVLVLAAVLLGLYATLSARAQELMVLRAIGAGRAFIWLTLWLQAIAMLIIGASLGVALCLGSLHYVARVLSAELGLAITPRLTFGDFWPMLVLLSAAALSAAAVAWRAYQRPLSAALRE